MLGPKVTTVRSEAYRRAVASLPCHLCGVHGYTQAAHADAGKALGKKSSDLTCYPLCGPRAGTPGCHFFVGTSGGMLREARRDLEEKAVEATQRRLIEASWEDRRLRALLVKLGIVSA